MRASEAAGPSSDHDLVFDGDCRCARSVGHRRQWIRIIKAKTSRDLALRPIAAAPAVMDAVQKMKKEHRRTVALFQTQIILPSATRASTSS